MRHISAIIIKYIMTAIVLAVVLPLAGRASLGTALLAAVFVTAISYLAADLLVLPYFGNVWAVFADFILATATIWATQFYLPAMSVSLAAALLAAAVLGVGEWFFHFYVKENVFRARTGTPSS